MLNFLKKTLAVIVFIALFVLPVACASQQQVNDAVASGVSTALAAQTGTVTPTGNVQTQVAQTLTAMVTPTLVPTNTNTPLPTFTGTPVPAGNAAASNCQDGEVTGNMVNKLDRTPIGDGQYATVQEVSVKGGDGFGGYWRWIQVTAALNNATQVFNVKVSTIHEVRYCGALDAVKTYASQANSHVQAMRNTAADGNGNMPATGEIPVVFIDPVAGTVTVLVAGTSSEAPSLAYIQKHVEIVQIQP